MATRATYQINHSCFYIHWDGYPEGAATYFWKMYKTMQTSAGGYAEAFLRANEGAEFTAGHERHGDTEWRYTLEGTRLSVYKRIWSDSDAPDTWPLHWSGDWWEFVNANAEHVKDWEPLEVINGAVKDRSALVDTVKKAADELVRYAIAHPQWVGNVASHQRTLEDAINALCEYGRKYPHQKKVAA
jgi:hypothetical protein